jgi:hypothetical protein
MTKNDRYGLINTRFDERASVLRKAGFKYEHVEDYGIAVFAYRELGMKKPHTIQASAVMYADDYFWGEIMEGVIQVVKK